MSLLLRALAWLSPSAAAERARVLDALALRASSYEGARKGRRSANMPSRERSANEAIGPELKLLRARSRDLVRNGFIGPRALSVLTTSVIGTDFSVRFATGSDVADRRVQALWDEWCQHCDIEGETTFTGLLSLALRSMFESGDALIRFVPRPQTDFRRVKLALHVDEGDLIDQTRDDYRAPQNGRRTRLGVVMTDSGERAGYWLFDSAPGETPIVEGTSSRFVPRSEVCHLYQRLRPWQARGVPLFAPVLMHATDFKDLVDALIVKERHQACIGLVVNSPDRALTLGTTETDDAGVKTERLAPGMQLRLRPGETATPFVPAGNSAFEPISRQTLMCIAAGLGLTYDQLTGDLSQANYSSLRAGKIEFRRLVADLQWHLLVPQAVARIVDRFVEAAVLSGQLKARVGGYPRHYVMPAHEPIDPIKDLNADILAVRSGRMSPQDFIGAWGRDHRQVLEETRAFFEAADAAGMVFDIDARNRTRTGSEIGQQQETVSP